MSEKEVMTFEMQYAYSLKRILNEGVVEHNRTGIDTLAVQHQYFIIRNSDVMFPILRAKKVYPKMALKELLWMLLGRTDLQWLHDHKVTYWDEWALEDGTIGRSYGCQYRDFNGVDQVKELVEGLARNPMSRRHIVNLWNASDLDKMALPPCMYDYHFTCTPIYGDGEEIKRYKVNVHAHARSNDSFLGVPYNYMFIAWFMYVVVLYLNKFSNSGNVYEVGDMHYVADNYHMYVNHKDAVKEYLANYQEDKDGVVSENRSYIFIDDCIFDGKVVNSFDDYLNILVDNISTKNIQIINKNATGFEYGPIKADIAV